MPILISGAGRRLEQARTVLLAVLTTAIVSMIVIAGYSLSSPRESIRQAQEFVRILRLETSSLVPSGRVSRNPAYRNPAVDLRPTPLMPAYEPGPEALLYPRPKPQQAQRR